MNGTSYFHWLGLEGNQTNFHRPSIGPKPSSLSLAVIRAVNIEPKYRSKHFCKGNTSLLLGKEIWLKLESVTDCPESSEKICFISISVGLRFADQWNLSLCSRGSSFPMANAPNQVIQPYADEHKIFMWYHQNFCTNLCFTLETYKTHTCYFQASR